MKYQLVLQWPSSRLADYDEMIRIEDALIEGLGEEHEVDGHDEGTGEVNIFIRTNTPSEVFSRIKEIINKDAFKDVRIAYREVSKSAYTILWPRNLTKFTVA